MPRTQPAISFQAVRNLTEKFSWRDPKTGARVTGFNPPADAKEKQQVPYFVKYVTGRGVLEQGEVITLKVDLRRHQRKVKFINSNQIRILRDYLIIEIDGFRVVTH
jgi:hypothetical protein